VSHRGEMRGVSEGVHMDVINPFLPGNANQIGRASRQDPKSHPIPERH
jgi:hypothetical protein